MKVVVFDTETTGMIQKGGKLADQPYIVQWGSISFDLLPGMRPEDIIFQNEINKLFRPTKRIPEAAMQIHHISNQMVAQKSLIYPYLEDHLLPMLQGADLIIAHNASYDMNVVYSEACRMGSGTWGSANPGKDVIAMKKKVFCTMKNTTELLKIKAPYNKKGYKWPKLQELHTHLFRVKFENDHDALSDVYATARCFVELLRRDIFSIDEGGSVIVN